MPSQIKHGLLCLAAIALCVCEKVNAQVIVSVKDGDWSSDTTWDGGVPNPDSQVTVSHNVTIPSASTLSVNNVNVTDNGRLNVSSGAMVTILPGGTLTLSGTGTLDVNGTIICSNNASLTGTTAINATFGDGSVFRTNSSTGSAIPLATWAPGSTLEITGLTGGGTFSNLNQHFGHVIYDCPAQGLFVEFGGQLTSIAGNFTVKNTNNNFLRLADSQNLNLTIGGDFIIEGASRVWCSATTQNNRLSIGGNFIYRSTSTSTSYFTTRGRAFVTIEKNLEINSAGTIRLSSETEHGLTELILKGNLLLLNGAMLASSLTTNSSLIFSGNDTQHFIRESTGTMSGRLNFIVNSNSAVDIGTSVISNTNGGSLEVYGKLITGWGGASGAIHKATNGNINIAGDISFYPESIVEYKGAVPQFIGNSVPGFDGVTMIINNFFGVSLLNDIQTGNLIVENGDLNLGQYSIPVSGDVSFQNGTIAGAGSLTFNGSTTQSLSANGHTIQNITIDKSGGSSVILTTPVLLTGLLSVLSGNSEVVSNGNLTLVSSSQETASVGILPDGSSITGNVTVQRFMKAIGRKYRYISSPVKNATVASLMDDFPITGIFNNPSTGPGMSSGNPSMFFYDEEHGGLNDGWKPYPSTGNSEDNLLTPGLGYSVFIREAVNPTIWDVTGTLNQGDFPFPVTYTPTGDPDADGWNLIGNPYPCAIRWGSAGWQRDNVSMGIAVRDNERGGFRYWDDDVGELTNGLIASGQSFWVRTTGNDPQLTLHETAKVTDGATFYRKRNTLDYIELEVKVNDLSDKTFLRLREGAAGALDNYDTPKLLNDFLSLSFVTDDNVSVAINAVGEISCHLEIPVKISMVQASNKVTFAVNGFGLLEGSDFHLYNAITGEKIKIDKAGSTLVFPSGMTSVDVLTLIIDSPMPGEAEVTVPHKLCGQDSLVIQVQPQKGIMYKLMYEGEEITTGFNQSSGSFVVPGKNLTEGYNSFQLVAMSACATRTMNELLRVEKIITRPPEVKGDVACQSGSMTLMAGDDLSIRDYHWYKTEEDTVLLYSGARYVTPILTKSRTYYVSSLDSNGCQSARMPVVAEIIAYDSVTITLSDGIMVSSYAAGNQWYFEGEILPGEDQQTLVPDKPGIYSVKVALGYCEPEVKFDFVVTDVEYSPGTINIQVYPNPSHERLFIRFRLPLIELFNVLSSDGTPVNYICSAGPEHESWEINTAHWPSGLYMLCFRIADDHSFIRIVKR